MSSKTQDQDDLLNEYIRVINHKDAEVHRLLSETSRLELELKKKEDKYKSKLSDLKAEVDRMHRVAGETQKDLGSQRSQCEQMRFERDALLNDVNTLKSALEQQDVHLHGIMKASSKAQKHEQYVREQIEGEYREKTVGWEDQLQRAREENEGLQQDFDNAARRLANSEKEASRWKVEVQRLQHQLEDSDVVAKELRRRISEELVSRDSVSSEVSSLGARHEAIVSGLEREINRLREELRTDSSKMGRSDAMMTEYRKKNQDLELELSSVSRTAHEADINLASERLSRAQIIEDLKQDYARDIASFKDQFDRLVVERSTLQGEVVVLNKRLQEADSTNALMTRRYQQDEESLEKELFGLRQQNSETGTELDSMKRVAQQQEALLKSFQAKLETQREEYVAESGRLRGEAEQQAGTILRNVASLKHSEAIIDDLRQQIKTLQSDLAEERNEVVKKEKAWRAKAVELESESRSKDEEKRMLLVKLEDSLRLLKNEHQSSMYQMERQHSLEVQKLRDEVSQLREQLSVSENVCQDRAVCLQNLEASIAGKNERERALMETQRVLDEKVLRLELQNSEKDTHIVALKRSLDSTTNALNSSQFQLQQTSDALDKDHNTSKMMEGELSSLQTQLQSKETEVRDLARTVTRVEAAANSTQQELSVQLQQMRERLNSLLQELHTTQQQNSMQRVEMGRIEQRHAEECENLRRDVLSPLQEKVEALVTMNQRLQQENQEKDGRLEELKKLQNKSYGQSDQIFQLQSDVTNRNRRVASLEEENGSLRDQVATLRKSQRELSVEQEESRRMRQDNESLARKIAALEKLTESSSTELVDLRARETGIQAELSQKKAELSSLQERFANLESLKNISEGERQQSSLRERELAEKLEDLRSSYSTLQVCFKKQQEQLEIGQKMREKDLKTREVTEGRKQFSLESEDF